MLGVPPHLRGREFIYRNANHLRVAEFQALMKTHLENIVAKDKGIVVTVSSDTNMNSSSEESKDAFIYMTSVKPIMSVKSDKYYSISSITNPDEIALLNQVRCFQFSVPFTKTGKSAYAKEINQQWKRTTILTTKDCFPSIVTRQLVIKRDIKELNPIENALEDVRERVEDMRAELSKQHTDPSETNNLKRLVQGTVAPQVTYCINFISYAVMERNLTLSFLWLLINNNIFN